MLFLDLPVVIIYSPLHQVEYQAGVEVWASGLVEYLDGYPDIIEDQSSKDRALSLEVFGIGESLGALDEEGMPLVADKTARISLGGGLA